MFHLLTCLTTFNIVGYINEIELNNLSWCFINMHLCILSSTSFVGLLVHFAMPCFIKPDMHHTCCASCHVYACVFTMLFPSFRFASLVSFGFVLELWGFVRLRPCVFFMDLFFFLSGFQARWPYPRNHFYLCLLVARSFAMPMMRYLPLALSCSHISKPRLYPTLS